jgi:hypothetical protein
MYRKKRIRGGRGRGGGGGGGGGEEKGEEHIHGRRHKTRDINILPGLKFGKCIYIHAAAFCLQAMLCMYVFIKIKMINP